MNGLAGRNANARQAGAAGVGAVLNLGGSVIYFPRDRPSGLKCLSPRLSVWRSVKLNEATPQHQALERIGLSEVKFFHHSRHVTVAGGEHGRKGEASMTHSPMLQSHSMSDLGEWAQMRKLENWQKICHSATAFHDAACGGPTRDGEVTKERLLSFSSIRSTSMITRPTTSSIHLTSVKFIIQRSDKSFS